MFQIAVVDTKNNMYDQLADLINKTLFRYPFDYQIKKFSNGEEFLEYKDEVFELVFLDSSIGDEDSIIIAKKMYEIGLKSVVIFISTWKETMSDAFGLNVYGYVMKEDIEERIPKMILRLLKDIDQKSYIFFKGDEESNVYCYKDILYFMIEDRKCYIQTTYGKFRIYAPTLKGIKEKLSNQFLQPNAKYIVNANYIKAMQHGEVLMEDDQSIMITRGKYHQFYEQYHTICRE